MWREEIDYDQLGREEGQKEEPCVTGAQGRPLQHFGRIGNAVCTT